MLLAVLVLFVCCHFADILNATFDNLHNKYVAVDILHH